MLSCELDLNGKSMFSVFFEVYISDSLLYSFQKYLISCFSLISWRRSYISSRFVCQYVVRFGQAMQVLVHCFVFDQY